MNLTSPFSLGWLTAAIAGIGSLILNSKWWRLAVTFLAILLLTCTSSLPVWAAPKLAALGAEEQSLSEEQKTQEELLKLTPTADQYSGLEYVEKAQPGRALSDAEITRKIKSDIKSDLVVNTSNGSVILSGTVRDKEKARQIVNQVKAIPGVKEVTFELGLQNLATQ